MSTLYTFGGGKAGASSREVVNEYRVSQGLPEFTLEEYTDWLRSSASEQVAEAQEWADKAEESAIKAKDDGEEQVALATEQAVNAKNSADMAASQVQATYYGTDSERLALTGMTSGQTFFTTDTGHMWRYSGSAWVDLGLGALALKADKETVDGLVLLLSRDAESPFLAEVRDSGGKTIAVVDRSGGLILMGLDGKTVQDYVMDFKRFSSAISPHVYAEQDNPYLAEIKDKDGKAVAAIDRSGGLVLQGLSGKTAQEELSLLRSSIAQVEKRTLFNDVSSPSLMKLSDAQNAQWGLFDMAGGLHLPGLSGTVQDAIGRASDRMEQLTKNVRGGQFYNGVTDLGCSPNFRGDCAVQINRAIDKIRRSVIGQGPVTIYFPPGDYRLETSILTYPNIALVGAGFTTRFLPVSWHAAIYCQWSETFDDGVPRYAENMIFANFQIEGENQTMRNDGTGDWFWVETKGIRSAGNKNCIYTDLLIQNTGATALANDYGDGSVSQRVKIVQGGRIPKASVNWVAPGSSGFGIGTGRKLDEPLIVADCQAYDCKNYGIFFEKQRNSTGALFEARGIIVHGFISRGNQYGLGLCGANGTLIASSQFNNNTKYGITIHSGTLTGGPRADTGAMLTGNQVLRNGSHGIYYNTADVASPEGFSTNGNRIKDNGGAGIYIKGNQSTATDMTELVDDKIIGNAADGIHVESGRFRNFDIISPVILNNTGAAIKLGGDAVDGVTPTTYLAGGRIFGATIRDMNTTGTGVVQTDSIVGTANLIDFDISGTQGVGCGPIALTGTKTRVTIGGTGGNVGV